MVWFYILDGPDGHTPVRYSDVNAWARWMEQSDRRVAFTEHGDVYVSTVFTGINARYVGKGPAIVFETMTFRGTTMVDIGGVKRELPASSNRDGETWKYATWDDALAGHHAICRRVFGKNYATATAKEKDS